MVTGSLYPYATPRWLLTSAADHHSMSSMNAQGYPLIIVILYAIFIAPIGMIGVGRDKYNHNIFIASTITTTPVTC